MIEQILELAQSLSIQELSDVIHDLRNLQVDKYNEQFVFIKIYPGSSIAEKIKSETSFDCIHVPSESPYGRGTHVIYVPKAQYSETLKSELVNKYDNLSL